MEPHAASRCDEIGDAAALLHQRETFHRLGDVFEVRRRHEADVRRFIPQERGVIDEKTAAAAELEIRVQHRLAGGGESLHHAIPAIHLVHEITVNAAGDIVLFEDLLRLRLALGQRRDELKTLAPLGQFVIDPRHGRFEIKTLVRPVRPGLLLAVQGVNNSDAGLDRGFRAVEPIGRGQQAQSAHGGDAATGQEVAPVHGTARAICEGEV